jgi:hypothetical protein
MLVNFINSGSIENKYSEHFKHLTCVFLAYEKHVFLFFIFFNNMYSNILIRKYVLLAYFKNTFHLIRLVCMN